MRNATEEVILIYSLP